MSGEDGRANDRVGVEWKCCCPEGEGSGKCCCPKGEWSGMDKVGGAKGRVSGVRRCLGSWFISIDNWAVCAHCKASSKLWSEMSCVL
jgi:hypothetical protein